MLQAYHKHIALLLLACSVAFLFAGAPTGGAFDWSDAPRHALNGVFLKDFLAGGLGQNPMTFAYQYYAQYPALTILLYPPLFYIVSAPFYALFGVSQTTALLVVALHYVAFAWGAWYLFRNWLSAWEAALATLMLTAAPEVAYWGRQVMLEIPAFAYLVWSAVFFVRYSKERRALYLYAAALLLVLAMYTKITAAFLGLAFAASLLWERGITLLRDKHVWLAALLAIVGVLPLVLITLKFGQANVQSVAGIADSVTSRKTLAGWLWYLRALPDQLGWPLTLAAATGVAILARRHKSLPVPSADLIFLSCWFVFGYLFFSAIDLKEARHSIFILPPLVFAAAMLCKQTRKPAFAAAALLVLAGAVLVQTLWYRPVHYVQGYAAAADFIAKHAPHHSKVLFSGYRDGSFIFNMRAREDRRDLSVVRADKLLLSVAVRRELGVAQKNLGEEDIAQQIDKLGVHYLVVQPGFWNDLAVMQKFEHVIASAHFEKVATIPTPANYPAHETELAIYKNLGNVNDNPAAMELGVPIIGKTIHAVR